jgi:diguanylate cyclase (GGDEF)-like protein
MGAIVFFLFIVLILWWKLSVAKKKLADVMKDFMLLKREREYYEESMLIFTANDTIVFANQSAKKLFSLNRDNEFSGIRKNIKLRLDDSEPLEFFEAIKKIPINDDSFQLNDVTLIIYDKEKKVNIFIDKSRWGTEEAIKCVIEKNTTDSMETMQRNKEGRVDFLTGLPSQFVALSDINNLVIESRKKSEKFAIFLFGIDKFDEIQTTLGLGHSNHILKYLAQYFIENPKEKMTVYRMESDKFLFIVEGVDDEKKSYNFAKDLIISVGNVYRENHDIRLTSSIGIVFYPKHGENASKLIDNAYIALHQAQMEDDSNIKLFDIEHRIILNDELMMQNEIRKGILKNEFLLYYQPIFDLDGIRMIGAEALLRWEHPKHGLIAADKFLEIAEKSGLIVDLGEYVFNEAILQRKRCAIGVQPDFQITINLSLKEMQVEELIPRLKMLFHEHKIQEHMINLDISEKAAMENIDRTFNDFTLLKNLGFSLSLDHYGSGCSSLKYLNMLPIDMIKIDRSLIFDLALNLQHQTTVKAIVELAHTLGYKVIAEGVETSKEADILKALHCDYAQGYLYSRPLSSTDFEELVS